MDELTRLRLGIASDTAKLARRELDLIPAHRKRLRRSLRIILRQISGVLVRDPMDGNRDLDDSISLLSEILR